MDVLERLGELRLAHLALERLLAVAGVERADELHRERRAALQRLAGLRVLERRPDDALEVDALVAVEALVLDRDGRVAHGLGHPARRDRDPQDVVLDDSELLAVGGVDARQAPWVLRLERAELGRGVRDADDIADGAQTRDDGPGDQHGDRDEDDAAGPAPLAASTLAFEASGHRRGLRGAPRGADVQIGILVAQSTSTCCLLDPARARRRPSVAKMAW